jgi:hypothetical protein
VDGRDKPGHDGGWIDQPLALFYHDLAGHAELSAGLAIAGLGVAAQVAGAAGCDRSGRKPCSFPFEKSLVETTSSSLTANANDLQFDIGLAACGESRS